MTKGLDLSQAHLYGVTDEAAQEFVDWRKSIKKPLTQRAFDRAMRVALKCREELGITADHALELVIDKGWQGVTFEYIKAELLRRHNATEIANGAYQRVSGSSRSERNASALREYLAEVEQGETGGGVDGLIQSKAGH